MPRGSCYQVVFLIMEIIMNNASIRPVTFPSDSFCPQNHIRGSYLPLVNLYSQFSLKHLKILFEAILASIRVTILEIEFSEELIACLK